MPCLQPGKISVWALGNARRCLSLIRRGSELIRSVLGKDNCNSSSENGVKEKMRRKEVKHKEPQDP